MQFGKIHGIALAVLGNILLGIQGMLYIPTEAVSTVRLSLLQRRLNINEPGRENSWRSISTRRCGQFFYEEATRRTRGETCRQVGANILCFLPRLYCPAAACVEFAGTTLSRFMV
jgi:hypothetical protein